MIESARGRLWRSSRLSWRTPFTIPGALFLVAGAISVVAAPDRQAALGLYRAYLLEPIAFFIVLSAIVQTAKRAYVVALGLWVGGLIVAIPNAIVVLSAMRQHTLDLAGTPPVVIYQTANGVALFLLPLIALAAATLLYGPAGWGRPVSAAFLAIALPAYLLTLSRGGYLALLVVGLGLALIHPHRWRWVGIAALLSVAFALIPPVTRRLAHELNPADPTNTLVGRSHLWKATLQMLQHHPIFGSGLSGFAKDIYPYWGALGRTDRFIDPHNILLNFWTETGGLGVIAFGWLLVAAFRVSWRGWRAPDPSWQARDPGWRARDPGWRARDPGWRAIHLGVFLALIGIVVHGLVDVPYFKNDLSLEFWTLLGLSWAATRVQTGTRRDSVSDLRRGN